MAWLGTAFVDAVRRGDLALAMTGAGSWLGRAFFAMLAAEEALPPPEKLRLFGSAARTVSLAGRSIRVEELARAAPLSDEAWLLLHFAFLGQERTADSSTETFVAANDAILADVLRIAAPATALRVVFSSSGAVYRKDRSLVGSPSEHAYGFCKAMHETRLSDWCGSRGVPLVMPRIFAIGGPFANKVESYALSSFILSAQREGVIRIRARRPTFRSYVHVDELLALLCDAALAQPPGTLVFDTVGSEVVEMAELAATIAATMPETNVRIERAAMTSSEPDRYVGEPTGYRALLHAQARTITPLARIVADEAAYLVAQHASSELRH